VLLGCSGENINDQPNADSTVEDIIEIKVDIEKAKELKMSEFFSNVSYYPLETPDNAPIGLIDKIMIQEGHIALYDKTKRSVWVYSKSGEYVSEVRIPYGRGPREIEHLLDVSFDKDLNIHALGDFKFLIFDLNGEVKKEVSFDLFVRKFIYDSDKGSYFSFAGGNKNSKLPSSLRGNNVFEFDQNGEIISTYMPFEENRTAIGYGIPNNFPTYAGEHYYFQHLYDTVYTFEGNDLKPAYYLNFGENKLTEEVLDKSIDYGGTAYTWSDFWDNEVEPYDIVAYKTTFEITDKFIHTIVGSYKENYMILYDRKTKVTHVGANTFLNDIDYGPSPFIYLSSDQSLYSYVEANDFLRLMNKIYKEDREKYFSTKMSRLRELANGMTDVKNPILMRLDFK
jgi:hypothetical protein